MDTAPRLRDQVRDYHALRSRSQRLEAELLKKTIQPHFLMNTLLSIQSWFGQDPAKAGRLVEALADEFRIISRVAAQPEIDMADEIQLCRRHLELMGYRKDAVYRLEVAGDCGGITVPPMLIHTLVENGLTHAYHAREDGTFWLECARPEGRVEFVLENDGSRLSELAAEPARVIEEGMGLKYVRSRLEESTPGRWELDYGLRQGRWRVRITIRRAAAR